jgi:hypothetical protein
MVAGNWRGTCLEVGVNMGLNWNRTQRVMAVVTVGLTMTLVAGRADAQATDPCGEPDNGIIAENCRPGSPGIEWDINGAGDLTIQGFATDISYNFGETAQFKIDTDSADYRVDIYRMGYYGGDGARKVATVKPSVSLPQSQPPCAIDWSVRLYDCGTWAVSASWPISEDAVSGVYVARLVRKDGDATWRMDNSRAGGDIPEAAPHAYGALGLGRLRNPIDEPRASHIVFVVRDDASQSDIVMQTSDPTWTAYNQYGLGNVYRGVTETGDSAGRPMRAHKASFNRPLMNRDFSSVNQLFDAEYPLLRWLERNGYDVSYISGVDTHRHGHLLQNHRLFISIGHDEYWSTGQRENTEAARDAGVNLAFLSGNEVFWKTRYEPSIDGSETPHRTLVVYKESHSNQTELGEVQPTQKIDPLADVWTGTWRDGSDANPEGPQPENALTGTIFTVNANRQDPLIVPAEYGRLRFWRNTEVAELEPGQRVVLANGFLGHEWDEDLDNGFRPAGLIRMSETTMDGVSYPMDWGSVYDSRTATHALTLYKAASGALVFGCGCVQYSWGLDNFHDHPTSVRGRTLNPYSHRVGVDPYGPERAIQQATVNLFADMGVQPAKLQSDLVRAIASTDETAPQSTVLSPDAGARVPSGLTTVTGRATDRGGVVAGVEVSVDGGTSWHRAEGTDQWSYEWEVPADSGMTTILSRASDDSVNLESAEGGVTVSYGTP